MPKIELTLSEKQKLQLQEAASNSHLPLATWAKSHLLAEASKQMDTDK